MVYPPKEAVCRDSGSQQPTLVYATTIPMSMKSFLKGQMTFMRQKGFRVLGISSPGAMLEEVGKTEQIETVAIPLERGFALFADLLTLIRLTVLFLRIKPTVVNASTPKAGLLCTCAAMLARVPVRVLVLHGLLTARDVGWKRNLLRAASWLSCRCAHQVMAVSASVAKGTVEEGVCPPSKIKVIGKGTCNGVDATGQFNPTRIDKDKLEALRSTLGIESDNPIIGFVGRIVRDKGIVELAHAWESIKSAWEKARLLLVGYPEAGDPVPAAILEKLFNDDRVITTDYVTNEEMPLYYALMRVLVLPSYREGFPTVALEAGSMEIPVIASKVIGSVDAVVDGVSGMLVPPRDTIALAEAIGTYLGDRHLAAEQGRAARNRVLIDFRPELIWKGMYEEYLRLMQDKGICTTVAGPGAGKLHVTPRSDS